MGCANYCAAEVSCDAVIVAKYDVNEFSAVVVQGSRTVTVQVKELSSNGVNSVG